MKKFLIVAIALNLLACQAERFVYSQDISQGRYVYAKKEQEITLGMSKQEVESLIGSPTLTGAFNSNRWIYLKTTKRHLHDPQVESRVVFNFKHNKLVSIEH